jgi:hypothetical protein
MRVWIESGWLRPIVHCCKGAITVVKRKVFEHKGVPSLSTKRYVGIGLGLIGLVLALGACSVAGPPKEPIDLTILHTGQVAGEISPCG